jgi:hypothetical protein
MAGAPVEPTGVPAVRPALPEATGLPALPLAGTAAVGSFRTK